MIELPNGWDKVKIDDIATVDSGQGAPQGDEWYNGGKTFVKAGDLNALTENKYVGNFCLKVNDEAIKKYNLKEYSANCIVFPKSGMSVKTDNIALLKSDSYVVNHLAVIQVIKNELCIPEYLFFLFRRIRISNLSLNDSYPSIRLNDIRKLKIPLPPLHTQNKIVAILEKAEQLKGWRREADELTDEFLKSTFLEMFGDPVKNPKRWEIKKLKETSEKFSDGPFGSNLKTEHYRNNGIRVIRLQNIGVNKFLGEDKAYVSEKHYSNLKKHSCVSGDIIIGTMGSPNLRACILPKSIELAINKADCIQCKPNKSLATSEYLCQLLNLPSTLIIASNMIHGQTRSRLSMGNLSTLSIPIPPLELQKQFSNVVQQIEELQEYQSQTKQHITDLFNTLMQEAFSGELT